MAISSRLKKTGIALVAVIAAFNVIDAGFAIHAERNLAKEISEATDLPAEPSVNIGGLAYTSSFLTGKWSSVNVRARDVEVEGFGLVSLEMGAANVLVPPSSVWSGLFEESPTKQYFSKLQLDGISLGRKMNFTDLVIQNLDDVSPAGGWETEALFEATPEGWAKPADVAVKLRIKERTVYITPDHIVKAPKDRNSTEIVDSSELSPETTTTLNDAFSLTMQGDELPLGIHPTRIYVTGGSITIEAEQIQCTVVPENFMPALSNKQEEKQNSASASSTARQSRSNLGPKNCWVR